MKSKRLFKMLSKVFLVAMFFSVVFANVKVYAMTNEFDTAEELYLDTKITAYQEGMDVYWYKFDMKQVTDRKNIKIILMGKSDFVGSIRMDVYDSLGQLMSADDYPFVKANKSSTWERNIADVSNDYKTFAKNEVYYFKVYSFSKYDHGNYTLLVTGDKKTQPITVSTSAKKGAKKFTVKTIAGANVTVSLNKAIIKNGKKKVKSLKLSSGNGEVKVALSRKLKKGDKIKISVNKSGYVTKKISKKIV